MATKILGERDEKGATSAIRSKRNFEKLQAMGAKTWVLDCTEAVAWPLLRSECLDSSIACPNACKSSLAEITGKSKTRTHPKVHTKISDPRTERLEIVLRCQSR